MWGDRSMDHFAFAAPRPSWGILCCILFCTDMANEIVPIIIITNFKSLQK